MTGLPVPGAVLGITLLFLGLCVIGRKHRSISLPAADGLLSYLALFFVPPGVYAALKLENLAPLWPAIMAGIVGSSILAMAVTGRVVQALLVRQERRKAADPSWLGRSL